MVFSPMARLLLSTRAPLQGPDAICPRWRIAQDHRLSGSAKQYIDDAPPRGPLASGVCAAVSSGILDCGHAQLVPPVRLGSPGHQVRVLRPVIAAPHRYGAVVAKVVFLRAVVHLSGPLPRTNDGGLLAGDASRSGGNQQPGKAAE